MKTIMYLRRASVFALAFVTFLVVSTASILAHNGRYLTSPAAQTPAPAQGEAAAIEKIKGASDANGALLAATDFVKNYPTSTARGEVGDIVAGKIATMTDAAQKSAMSEKMMAVFTGVDEVDGLFDALQDAKQYDEMFKLGSARV